MGGAWLKLQRYFHGTVTISENNTITPYTVLYNYNYHTIIIIIVVIISSNRMLQWSFKEWKQKKNLVFVG